MTRSVCASGTATVLILLSGCTHGVGNDRLTASKPPPASGTTEGNPSALPVIGAYGFTESQAKTRLEASGYNNISNLEKDPSGNWHGTAEKNGLPVSVGLFGAYQL